MGFTTEQRITGAICDGCGKSIAGEIIRARDDDQLVRTYCTWKCTAGDIAKMVDMIIDDPVPLSTYVMEK